MKGKLPPFDVCTQYKPFEIVKTDNNTIVIQSQIIPNGTKKGYVVKLMFDFEQLIEYEYIEDVNDQTKLHLTFDPAKMEITEVKR